MEPVKEISQMSKKLNPLQMVAKEVSFHNDIDEDVIYSAISDLLSHLQNRAFLEIDKDATSDGAKSAALQYRVICEAVAVFGIQLIAAEDGEYEEYSVTTKTSSTDDSN